MRAHRKHTQRRAQTELTANEIDQLRQPQIPLELWRRGEALLGRKLERITRQQVGRDVTNNAVTRKIIADKAELRKLIANDPQLVKDFEFFTTKLGWDPEGLLQHLYWDCNMMHASQQAILASEKRATWPLDQNALANLCEDISALAVKLEELNETDFSPARTAILRTADGVPLPRAQGQYLLVAFRDLPEILGFYSRELRRKVLSTARFWSRHKHHWKSIIESVREGSLYEKIRARAERYHAVRLHRLVNAARQVQGLPLLELRAFVIWLNRLRARREKSKLLPAPPSGPVKA